MREQRVFLALDEAPFLAIEAGLFLLADLIEPIIQVAQDVEPVEEDGGLRGMTAGRVAKGFPHVHHRRAHAGSGLSPKEFVEFIHALFAGERTAA